jgi:hypothetical protein
MYTTEETMERATVTLETEWAQPWMFRILYVQYKQWKTTTLHYPRMIVQVQFEKLHLHTKSFYSVDEFLICKIIYSIFVKCLQYLIL